MSDHEHIVFLKVFLNDGLLDVLAPILSVTGTQLVSESAVRALNYEDVFVRRHFQIVKQDDV